MSVGTNDATPARRERAVRANGGNGIGMRGRGVRAGRVRLRGVVGLVRLGRAGARRAGFGRGAVTSTCPRIGLEVTITGVMRRSVWTTTSGMGSTGAAPGRSGTVWGGGGDGRGRVPCTTTSGVAACAAKYAARMD